MEGLRDHRAAVAAVLATILGGVSHVAAAQETLPPYDMNSTAVVYTTPEAAVVEASQRGRGPGQAAAVVHRSKRRCSLKPQGNIGAGSAELWAQRPDEALFTLSCDGQFVGMVWRRISPGPAPGGGPFPLRR